MSASLKEMLSSRRRLAAERAATLAEQVASGDSRSIAAQAAIDEALTDVRHYTSLFNDLAEVAGETGVYGRHTQRSIIADLAANDPHGPSKGRVDASNREVAADVGVERRDLGASTTLAAIPSWLVADARPMAIKRAPIVTAIARPLPQQGLKIRLPQFTTEPTAGPQSALNGALVTATFADNGFEADVQTFGAQVQVPQQIVELTPAMLDRQVLPALVAAVDAAIEESLWSGAGTSGHVEGLLEADNTNTETYTDTTPTLVEAYPKIETLVREVETAGAYGGTPVVAMHPRRLSWIRQAAVVEKIDLGWAPPPFPGATAGWFGGSVAVIADSAAPTTRGAGTNEDAIVVMRSLDVLDLYTAPPLVRVSGGSAGSGGLSATVTVSRLVAFSAERLAGAVGILSGTGLVAP